MLRSLLPAWGLIYKASAVLANVMKAFAAASLALRGIDSASLTHSTALNLSHSRHLK